MSSKLLSIFSYFRSFQQTSHNPIDLSQALPTHVALNILAKLDLRHLAKCMQVSQNWYRLCYHPDLWKMIAFKHDLTLFVDRPLTTKKLLKLRQQTSPNNLVHHFSKFGLFKSLKKQDHFKVSCNLFFKPNNYDKWIHVAHIHLLPKLILESSIQRKEEVEIITSFLTMVLMEYSLPDANELLRNTQKIKKFTQHLKIVPEFEKSLFRILKKESIQLHIQDNHLIACSSNGHTTLTQWKIGCNRTMEIRDLEKLGWEKSDRMLFPLFVDYYAKEISYNNVLQVDQKLLLAHSQQAKL